MFPLSENTCLITDCPLLKMESLLRSSSFSGSALKALAMAEAVCEASAEETFVDEAEAVEQVHIVQMYLVVQQTALLL